SGVTVLDNGDYVVRSPNWNRNRGAATWVDGVKGITVTGPVSSENSLVGPNENDFVGSSVTGLTNGNYVVSSPRWNENRGAVTWGGGAGGVTGEVTVDNSVTGQDPNDLVGRDGVTALANGNYVISSPFWSNFRGAVTWGDGDAGTVGTVSALNSLVGTNPNEI